MSQQFDWEVVILSANILAYLDGCKMMNGWPKQVEKVGEGSVMPSSVPGVLEVYPSMNQL